MHTCIYIQYMVFSIEKEISVFTATHHVQRSSPTSRRPTLLPVHRGSRLGAVGQKPGYLVGTSTV